MYSWLVKRRIRRNLERLRAGDSEPLLRSYADGVAFRFPGDHSWAADSRGKSELRPWLERFIGVGLQLPPGRSSSRGRRGTRASASGSRTI